MITGLPACFASWVISAPIFSRAATALSSFVAPRSAGHRRQHHCRGPDETIRLHGISCCHVRIRPAGNRSTLPVRRRSVPDPVREKVVRYHPAGLSPARHLNHRQKHVIYEDARPIRCRTILGAPKCSQTNNHLISGFTSSESRPQTRHLPPRRPNVRARPRLFPLAWPDAPLHRTRRAPDPPGRLRGSSHFSCGAVARAGSRSG